MGFSLLQRIEVVYLKVVAKHQVKLDFDAQGDCKSICVDCQNLATAVRLPCREGWSTPSSSCTRHFHLDWLGSARCLGGVGDERTTCWEAAECWRWAVRNPIWSQLSEAHLDEEASLQTPRRLPSLRRTGQGHHKPILLQGQTVQTQCQPQCRHFQLSFVLSLEKPTLREPKQMTRMVQNWNWVGLGIASSFARERHSERFPSDHQLSSRQD